MYCHEKRRVVVRKRPQKGEGGEEGGRWRAWERRASGIDVEMKAAASGIGTVCMGSWTHCTDAREVRERATDKTLARVCSARTRGSRRETAAMCLAGGGACGRSPGATSQTHAHANEVVAHLTDIPAHVFAMSLGRPSNGKGGRSKDTLGTVCSRHCRQRIDVRESGATWHKDVRRRKGSGGPLTSRIYPFTICLTICIGCCRRARETGARWCKHGISLSYSCFRQFRCSRIFEFSVSEPRT
jgi:hypothetical protein